MAEITKSRNTMKLIYFIIFRFHLFIILFIYICSCSTSKLMVNSMKPMMEKMGKSVNRNTDVEMVRDAFPSVLLQIDGLLEISPDNEFFLSMASQSYSVYSFAFIEDKDKDRARKLYLKARNYALRILKHKKDFIEAISINTPLDEFILTLGQFSKDDVAALYLIASSWMQWISISLDNMDVFLDIPKVEAIFKRILELDENYNYGSPHLFFGIYYSVRPEIFRGQLEKAKYHFDRAFEISRSKVLFVHLYYAKYYAVQIHDKELYIKILEKILSSPENLLLDMNFANEVAKMKAKILLKKIDEYF